MNILSRHIAPPLNTTFSIIALFSVLLSTMVYLEQIALLHLLVSAIRFACFPLCIIMSIRYRLRPGWLEYLLLLYLVCITGSTIINHNFDLVPILSNTINAVIVWSILRIHLQQNNLTPIRALIFCFSFLIFINLILLILFPDGLWLNEDGNKYYLLGGNYNQFGKAIFLGVALNMIYSQHTHQLRFHLYFILFISFLTLILVHSQTSVVGLFILTLCYFIKNRKYQVFILRCLVIGYCCFTFLFVLKGNAITNGAMTYVIRSVLHKDLTFSKRTTIWVRANDAISERPIYGYGWHDSDWYKDTIYNKSPHNLLLAILIKGGILLLGCFILLLICTHIHSHRPNSPPPIFILICLWVFMIMSLMEAYNMLVIFTLLIINQYIPTTCHQDEGNTHI